jgi:hypothetical protein
MDSDGPKGKSMGISGFSMGVSCCCVGNFDVRIFRWCRWCLLWWRLLIETRDEEEDERDGIDIDKDELVAEAMLAVLPLVAGVDERGSLDVGGGFDAVRLFLAQVQRSLSKWQGQLAAWVFVEVPHLHFVWSCFERRESRQCEHWVAGRPLGLIMVSGMFVWLQPVTLWPRMQRWKTH